ncbi:hypothetical protein OEZ86_000363 [Tetradesmus obliquus]|nr:hypothetical protein OEZ86_000363 [Tetradesmus obliquus]
MMNPARQVSPLEELQMLVTAPDLAYLQERGAAVIALKNHLYAAARSRMSSSVQSYTGLLTSVDTDLVQTS